MNIFSILILILFPSIAYAFPVAEGVNALATLLGVFTSVIAGVSPKFIFKKRNEKSILISLFLFILLIIVSFTLLFNNIKKSEEIENSIQSRPVLLNNVNQYKDYIEYDFDIYKNYINENINLLFDINDYYNDKYQNYKIINIDYRNGDLSQYPNHVSTFDLKNREFSDFLKIVEEEKGNVLLFSHNFLKAINVSQETFNIIGYKLPVIQNYKINYEIERENLNSLLDKKGVTLTSNEIFNKNLFDLRSVEDIAQTHTLENAEMLSIADLYHLTNKEIIDLLNNYKEPVFISFNESDYLVAENRLKDIKGIDYKYLSGGLNKHFEKGNTLTPKYINLGRYLEPSFVMNEYAKNKDIKFICTEKEYCLNNIPVEDTIILSYRDLGKKQAKEIINNLNNDYRYILLSNNQETDGNALLAGYWLSESNKVFVGTLPLPDRFSLEYIRHNIINDDSISLDEYRENIVKNNIINYHTAFKILNFLIENIGWLSTFLILGLLFRILLMRVQVNIYNCYYKYNTNVFITLLSSLIIICSILFVFNILNNLLINYGLIDFKLLFEINQGEIKSWLAAIFSIMVIFQAYITFPVNKKSFYVIAIIVISIYLLGYINELNTPILAFLTGSEFISLFCQIPFYLKFKRLYNLHKKGIYLETFKYMPELPEKWFLVNNFIKTNGLLIKLSNFNENKLIVNKYIKNNKKYIIRSCSSLMNENNLAGYYNSIVCDAPNVNKEINLFIEKGEIDYVWLQPYYNTIKSGVAQSYYKSKSNVLITMGENDSATEGKKNTDILIVKRNKIFGNKTKRIINLIKKIERYYKRPVIIEYGLTKYGIILYQIRMMNKDDIKVIKLKDYKLSEDFLTKSTYMTGSILEYISNKDYLFYRGFLYSKKIRKYKKFYVNNKDLIIINEKLKNIEKKLTNETAPIVTYHLIEELLYIYKNLYNVTQSLISPKNSLNIMEYNYFTLNGDDLEISNKWKKENNNNYGLNTSYRDMSHNLILYLNYLLNKSILLYTANNLNIWSLTIEELLSESIINKKAIYENFPINNDISNLVIVPGKIKGKVFLIDKNKTIEENLLLLDNNEDLILTSDEIGSGWVKHLDKFSGIISLYGHPLSHLSISAKQLNIPYTKVLTLPDNNELLDF